MRQIALDLLALAGLGLLLWGLYQVYPPAAPMVGGVAMIVIAVLGSRGGR